MTNTGFPISNPYTILDNHQLDTIHEATLEILKKTGNKVESEDARKILGSAGCDVDDESMMVRFPPDVVESALKTQIENFTFNDVQFSTNSILFGTGIGIELADRITGQRRPPMTRDVAEIMGFIGAMDNIDIIFPPIGFLADQPMLLNFERMFAETLKYATKTYTVSGLFGADPKWQIMLSEIAGKQLICGGSSGAPLTMPKLLGDYIIPFAQRGWPVLNCGGGNMGATSPATFAGSLVTQNAEVLGTFVLARIINPNCPLIYGSFVLPMDMRIAAISSGGPECSLIQVATAQIARYYHVPSWIFAPMTDSKVLDEQAGYEKGMQWLTTSISGTNAILGAGHLENEMLMSYEQLAIDDELIGWIKHFMRGITINKETLALDLIHEVGPVPGHYLTTKMTKEWWKKEQFLTKVSDRHPYKVWSELGSKDVVTKAKERVEAIFRKIEPAPVLPDDVCKEMDKIIADAEKYEMARQGPPGPGA